MQLNHILCKPIYRNKLLLIVFLIEFLTKIKSRNGQKHHILGDYNKLYKKILIFVKNSLVKIVQKWYYKSINQIYNIHRLIIRD